MLLVKVLGGEGAHVMEVLVLISVFPAYGLRRAAKTNTGHPEHLHSTHSLNSSTNLLD